ncbi:lytic polysaccharide monooxygenase [Cupriavidus necator]|nr:lytic polysaccharide monooxygenase [Cupriavidus necator]
MKIKQTVFPALLLLGGALVATPARAHGVVEFPIARQLKCFQDGGFWYPADGSGVPNAACREAFRRSGAYPFQQWNEITGFPQDYNSQASVEQAIKDGTLCSGGDPRKAGLDVRSTQWHKTPIKPQNGKIRVMFYATAAHNPSFVRIYLTKASYVHGEPLRWTDLEQIYAGAAPAPQTIGGKRYYVYDVPIPAGRTGNAVLYLRWQRQDAGREGFYNCSDVTIESAAGVPTDGFPWFGGASSSSRASSRCRATRCAFACWAAIPAARSAWTSAWRSRHRTRPSPRGARSWPTCSTASTARCCASASARAMTSCSMRPTCRPT